ncbi:hypothetical protein K0M31_010031 [Melipona bicolor]|uniref:Uncharacterized protein n=1 Tax=Melipona bicolor TaxID=60889 RepID=A0AA40KIL7_9HYME|nr:hypothetical protein K0M31_010031 [Melipona bicolor]
MFRALLHGDAATCSGHAERHDGANNIVKKKKRQEKREQSGPECRFWPRRRVGFSAEASINRRRIGGPGPELTEIGPAGAQ